MGRPILRRILTLLTVQTAMENIPSSLTWMNGIKLIEPISPSYVGIATASWMLRIPSKPNREMLLRTTQAVCTDRA
jgi:hypothetical protein